MKKISDIKAIIKQGESQTVEFKQSFDREAIETISAFANSSGGVLVVGVKDNGTISGITITSFSCKTISLTSHMVACWSLTSLQTICMC